MTVRKSAGSRLVRIDIKMSDLDRESCSVLPNLRLSGAHRSDSVLNYDFN